MESIIKKILDKDQNIEISDIPSNGKIYQILSLIILAFNKFKEGFSNRKIQDIMRCELQELRELLEVIKELSALINQTLSEKKQLQA